MGLLKDLSLTLFSLSSTTYIVIGALASICLLAAYIFRTKQSSPKSFPADIKSSPSPSYSKNPPRKPGQWIPSSFRRPKASPYPNWDLQKTKPIPYRPFRWGTYHITMGLRTMPWDEWIELDNRYLEFHALKAQRIRDRGSRCCRTAPEAFEGACELLEEFSNYLPERYPSLFRKTEVGLDNLATGESFNIVERPLKEDPMMIAARLIQDDLTMLFEQPDDQVHLLAGSICLPGFWRLEDKFGMPLSEIHTSGNVPGYKEKLQKGMESFFRRITPDKPAMRNNYFFQLDDNIAWSESLGDEDQMGDGGHVGWLKADESKSIESHRFRHERQTIRRLPRSGGIVFTVRTYFEPVVDIASEPGVPGRLASGVRGWPENVDVYKGKAKWGDVLLEYLDAKHKEQKEQGIVGGEEVNENYPF